MGTHTILSRDFSTPGSDITYWAYVPYDDPSRDLLLTHISEFLPRRLPSSTLHSLLLLFTLRSTWLCTSTAPCQSFKNVPFICKNERKLRWLTELIFQIRHSVGILECQRRPPGLQMFRMFLAVSSCFWRVLSVLRAPKTIKKQKRQGTDGIHELVLQMKSSCNARLGNSQPCS